MTYTVNVYDYNPSGNFPTVVNSTFTYSGPAAPETTIDIDDTGDGVLDVEDYLEATGTITINGNTSTNEGIYAKAGWTVEDTTTGKTFEVITLTVHSGAAAGDYMISEVPMVSGGSYKVTNFSTYPDGSTGHPVFTYADYVCFASGTMIETVSGPKAIETLQVGDQVVTYDHGLQPLLWIGRRALKFRSGPDPRKPILISANSLGPGCPARDLTVSPRHRILLGEDELLRIHGHRECLGMAKGLTGRRGIRRMLGQRSTVYHTLLTPRHEIIFANGLAAETFYPGLYGVSLLSPRDRFDLTRVLPGVASDVLQSYGPPARKILKHRELQSLTSGHGIRRPMSSACCYPLGAVVSQARSETA